MSESSDEANEGRWRALRRRKVVQWGLAYAAGAWACLQGLAYLSTVFQWPQQLQRLATVALMAGLSIALVLAWYHGDKGQQRVSGREFAILIALLLMGGGLLGWVGRMPEPTVATAVALSSRPRRPPSTRRRTRSRGAPPICKHGRGQAAGILFRRPVGGAARLPRANQRAAGCGPHLILLLQGRTCGSCDHRAQVECRYGSRGSARRSGNTIRVTAQLSNAVTGYHLWSQTYDRDLGDVLKLQTDIANAVANALRVTLLGDVAAKIEVGGTRNPAAFDAYLRASNAYRRFGPANLAAGGLNREGLQTAVDAYAEAIRADREYALAYAGRSIAFADFARALVSGPGAVDYLKKAQSDARNAIALAPDLAEGHLALANFYAGSLELASALQEYERALALAPGDSRVLREYGAFAVLIGRTEAGLAAAHRVLVLDPLNSMNHFGLGVSLAFRAALRRSHTSLPGCKGAGSGRRVRQHVAWDQLLLER